jgi:quercetin dioxygenase-like cupin family protein
MTLTPFVTRNDQVDALWQVDILWMMLATSEQTGGAYTLIEELCPRGSGPPPHWHEQHELFYVIDGEVTFLTGEDERRIAGPGSFVFIPTGTVHSFRVDSDTCRLLNGYTPGGFEKVIYTLGMQAKERTLPPKGIDKPFEMEVAAPLFAEIGMHGLDGTRDVLRDELASS